jgi:hypothetical protein
MRVGEEYDACIAQQGVQYIGGRTPLGPAARGGSSARGCASPNPNPNGLWQPIRVRGAAATGGRQQPTARVEPPQTLMGCGPAVVAAQSYTIR